MRIHTTGTVMNDRRGAIHPPSMGLHMKKLLLAAAALALLASSIPAGATNCTTTCYGSGNSRTCNTFCF